MKLSERLRSYICGCGDHIPDELLEHADAADAVIAAAREAVELGKTRGFTPSEPMDKALNELKAVQNETD